MRRRSGGARRPDRRDQCERERENVGADVDRIAGQRQALRSRAAPELEQRDERRRNQRKDESPANRHRAAYAPRARNASATNIAPKSANVLLSAEIEGLDVPFAVPVGERFERRHDARDALAISLELFAELRAQKGFFVRHDCRRRARPSPPSDPADEPGAGEARVFSGKGERVAGGGNEVAEIERVTYVGIRTGRDELGRGYGVVARRDAGVSDRPATNQLAGDRERQADGDARRSSAVRKREEAGREAQQRPRFLKTNA